MQSHYPLILALLLLTSEARASTPGQCPAYEEAIGPQIRFGDTELTKQYGFQRISFTPDAKSIPHSELAGRLAKFTGNDNSQSVFKFYTAVLEDCRSLYFLNAGDDPLSRSAERIFEFTFIGEDIDARIEAMRATTDWRTVEQVDPMTDAKSCYVTTGGLSRKITPMFFYHSREGFSITLIGADFPGKAETFRVDKNKAVSGREGLTGAAAQAFVDQARKGRVLRVAGYTWPYETQELDEYNLGGLGPKLDACRAFIR
jgi:hypothetical protein